MAWVGRYILNGLTGVALCTCGFLLLACAGEETYGGRYRFASREQDLGRYAGTELEAYYKGRRPRHRPPPQPVTAYSPRGALFGIEWGDETVTWTGGYGWRDRVTWVRPSCPWYATLWVIGTRLAFRVPSWRGARVARRRAGRGLCPACGYDVRATPARCPECGRAAGGAVHW